MRASVGERHSPRGTDAEEGLPYFTLILFVFFEVTYAHVRTRHTGDRLQCLTGRRQRNPDMTFVLVSK